jgi:hypothetical protein
VVTVTQKLPADNLFFTLIKAPRELLPLYMYVAKKTHHSRTKPAFYSRPVRCFAEAFICLLPGITRRVALKTSGQNAA